MQAAAAKSLGDSKLRACVQRAEAVSVPPQAACSERADARRRVIAAKSASVDDSEPENAREALSGERSDRGDLGVPHSAPKPEAEMRKGCSQQYD